MERQLGNRSQLQWFVNTKLEKRKVRHALGIGVGAANAEIELLAMEAAEHYRSLRYQRSRLGNGASHRTGPGRGRLVSFYCRDANSIELPAGKYGLVHIHGVASSHHRAGPML